MKSAGLGLAIASLAIGAASCESPRQSFAAGVRPVSYDAYYDDAYGPFYDGYWGDDGAFYYCGGAGRPFIRDGGGHFQHGGAGGFHPVHGGGARR
jgi:hypothetical protein